MAKVESRMEFPLFAPPEVVHRSGGDQSTAPHSVSSITQAIRDTLESKFTDITVEGEVSNFVEHRSGHRYWTLKDDKAQISCVLWKSRVSAFKIGDGQKVLCRGRLTVYPPRGNYQFDVYQIRPIGIGALQAAFDALYKKLLEEGLFDLSRKRSIPSFPRKIGIITSPTGAALHDILTVLRRRYPVAEVLFRPAAVQGIGAELEIARAITEVNLLPANARPYVLIVGRGGGSLEDLWAFNEEAVARAIYASKIPVISAVGHEVDVTIADFVADLRAPTPTAAAELATPDRNELLASLSSSAATMDYFVKRKLADVRNALAEANPISLIHPLGRVGRIFSTKKDVIGLSLQRMQSLMDHLIELSDARIGKYHASLRALSPYSVLERGYAIIEDEQGSVIAKAAQMPAGNFDILFSDGKVHLRRTA
jgi:exodeoxyribonuclease VII large subunit